MADGNKKITVAAKLATVILVACMAAAASAADEKPAAVGGGGGGGGGAGSSVCAETTFKDTCEKSIAKANSSNPKDLIKAAFNAAVDELQTVIKNSATYKKVKSDKMTKGALAVCEEVLNNCIFDLKRSFDRMDSIETGKLNNNIADLRNWLSATVAHKETCIDAFQNTTGDTGRKVTEMLQLSGEMLSNALAMVTGLQKLLGGVDLGGIASKIFGGSNGGTQRQLLGDLSDVISDEIPDFVDTRARKLMAAEPMALKPDITVAQDGSGQFKTITEALRTLPAKNTKPVVIFVKAGFYQEYLLIAKGVKNVALIGEGPLKTIISGNKSYEGGVQTFHSGTLIVSGDGFMAKDIAIENTVMHTQAVAIRVNADMVVFYNVHINGFQDTLYAHSYKQFYSNCLISGTIDYIFGDAKAIFQNCELVVRKPLPKQACMVTAQGRVDPKSDGVTVIQNCHITAEKAFLEANPPFEAYLGRPWKNFSRTIVMQSNIDGFIQPAGWFPWSGTIYLDTLYYAEWQNRGPGSNTSQRVTWKGIEKKMSQQIADRWLAQSVYVTDDWVKKTGVPYSPGMMVVPNDPPK